MANNKEKLNLLIDQLKKDKKYDCYLVYRTTGFSEEIIGQPLAIYRTLEGLEKHFLDLIKGIDQKWGISIGGWDFDA